MISLTVGTACLPSSIRSVTHQDCSLGCYSRACAIGYSSLIPAVPAAFRRRKQLSATLLLPVVSSAAQYAAVPRKATAASDDKLPRKRQELLLSTGRKQHGFQQLAHIRNLTLHPLRRSSKAFKKSNSSSRGIIVQQVQAVFSFIAGTNLENLFSSLRIAVQLLRIETEGAYAGLVAGSPIADDLDTASRDSRQVTFSVSNIVRWQRRLDFLIGHLTGKACSRLETTTHAILRLAVHELTFQHLPAHAISEHVNLAKALVRPAAGNLVNAVLRRLVREQEAGVLPEPPLPSSDTPPEQAADMLAVATSHPTWMVQRWVQRWGQEATVSLLHHNNRSSPKYAVRVSPGRDLSLEQLVSDLQEAGLEAELSHVLPKDFLVVNGLQHLIRQGFLERGDCQVQDEAAGLVVALLDPRPGEAILDACAAPGGKALYAAARMQGQGRLVAMDINKRRLGALKTAAGAQGVQGLIRTQASDLCQYAEWVAQQPEADRQQHCYDRVLLDAPCSGLGVLAKRVDLRWRRKPEELHELTALQAKLLNAAASLVKPGGLLVYSTCSIEPEENADQVTAFLQHHPKYKSEPAPDDLVPSSLVTADGHLQTMPDLHDMDGAFGARLRRAV